MHQTSEDTYKGQNARKKNQNFFFLKDFSFADRPTRYFDRPATRNKLFPKVAHMDKKYQKCPQNGFFPPFATPKIFFKNRALSLLYPYGVLTSCKKLEKSLELSLRYLKTDERTDRHG